jgi:subtilisin family serine protease
MKQTRTLSLAALIMLSVSACQKTNVAGPDSSAVKPAVTGRSLASANQTATSYIIMTKDLAVSQDLLTQIDSLGAVTSSLPDIGVIVASSSSSNFSSALSKRSDVLSVTPDISLNWLPASPQQATAVTDSMVAVNNAPVTNAATLTSSQIGLSGTNPFVPDQWNLQAVNAPAAFRAGYKGQGAVVAVLDGGFATDNQDIAPNIISATSFVPGEAAKFASPTAFSHATHVAGIIAAADNDYGTVGIAPSAKLMLVKVLNDAGNGQFAWMIQGVYYAASHGANIINLSLGGEIPRNGTITDANGTTHDAKDTQPLIIAMNRAFKYAADHNVLCLAAAGNDAANYNGQGSGTFYPAACTNVLAVSSTGPLGWGADQTTSLFPFSYFSDYGAGFVSFSGPGGNLKFPLNYNVVQVGPISDAALYFDMVLSPGNTHTYYFEIGTSMATPAVTGVAALIAGKYNGNISVAQLKTKLFNSTVDLVASGTDPYYGHGQPDAGLAIQQ